MIKKFYTAFCLLGVILMLAGLSFAAPEDEAAAVQVAETWLATVDTGKYLESWNDASRLFKLNVEEEEWTKSLGAIRGPLGDVKSRQILSQRYVEELPGVPDGKYVIIQYQTAFENKKSAVETITPMLEQDGQWRVSGYYIN